MHIIHKYFPGLSEKQTKQFADLQSLYQNWNAQINVISRKDIDKLYTNHILHSLAIAKVIQFKKGTSILDIGTGGGFPGIPLAILFSETDFPYIIENNNIVNFFQNHLSNNNSIIIGGIRKDNNKYD